MRQHPYTSMLIGSIATIVGLCLLCGPGWHFAVLRYIIGWAVIITSMPLWIIPTVDWISTKTTTTTTTEKESTK